MPRGRDAVELDLEGELGALGEGPFLNVSMLLFSSRNSPCRSPLLNRLLKKFIPPEKLSLKLENEILAVYKSLFCLNVCLHLSVYICPAVFCAMIPGHSGCQDLGSISSSLPEKEWIIRFSNMHHLQSSPWYAILRPIKSFCWTSQISIAFIAFVSREACPFQIPTVLIIPTKLVNVALSGIKWFLCCCFFFFLQKLKQPQSL